MNLHAHAIRKALSQPSISHHFPKHQIIQKHAKHVLHSLFLASSVSSNHPFPLSRHFLHFITLFISWNLHPLSHLLIHSSATFSDKKHACTYTASGGPVHLHSSLLLEEVFSQSKFAFFYKVNPIFYLTCSRFAELHTYSSSSNKLARTTFCPTANVIYEWLQKTSRGMIMT